MIGMSDRIGALKPGMEADISVLDLLDGRFELRDNTGDSVVSPQMIMPSFALKAGRRFDVVSPLVPPAVQLAA
jgi:dihydroorotase